MAQTALTMGGAIKDVWTDEQLQKQFEDKNAPLGRLESVRGTMIGTQAQVPILGGRAGSFTSVGPAGGGLNPATAQPVAQATYTMPQNWFQIELETSALVQTGSNAQSVVSAKDLEIQGAVENTRHQISRMIVTNGDGVVAACATTASSQVIGLTAAAAEGAAYGYQALVRGWLPVGQYIDIGTTADTDALTIAAEGTGYQIAAVNNSPTAPTITLNNAAVATTAGTHFVYIRNPNSTTAANPEVNGLRQLIGNGAFGGLNPATAGQEFWAGGARDTVTTTFSLDLALGLQRAVMQNSNNAPTTIWTGYRQQANLYALLQNQVQFSGDQNLAAGNVSSPKWNGTSIDAFADILDSDFYMLTLSDLVRIKGNLDSPKWASDIEGSGGALRWRQGFTSFVDGVVYPLNMGARRRNTHAGAIALK